MPIFILPELLRISQSTAPRLQIPIPMANPWRDCEACEVASHDGADTTAGIAMRRLYKQVATLRRSSYKVFRPPMEVRVVARTVYIPI
jgi:hypothetical protein